MHARSVGRYVDVILGNILKQRIESTREEMRRQVYYVYNKLFLRKSSLVYGIYTSRKINLNTGWYGT